MKKIKNWIIACICFGVILSPFIKDPDQIVYIAGALLRRQEGPVDHVAEETKEYEEIFWKKTDSAEEKMEAYHTLTDSYMKKSRKSEFGQQLLTIEKWFEKKTDSQVLSLPNSNLKGQRLTYTIEQWYVTKEYSQLPSVDEVSYPPDFMEEYMLDETTLKPGYTWLCAEVTVTNESDLDFDYYTVPAGFTVMDEGGDIYWYVGKEDIYSSNQTEKGRKAFFYELSSHASFSTTYCAICPKAAVEQYTPYLILDTSSRFPYDPSTGGLMSLK